MNLKVSKQSNTGLNTEFVNVDSGRHISLNHAIKNGNPNYKNYQTVNLTNGTTYIRSKADGCTKNNIE